MPPWLLPATFGASALSGLIGGMQQSNAIEDQINATQQMYQQSRTDNATAVQTRKADLLAAGMSPTLAAGSSAGVSAPVQLQTRQPVNPASVLSGALGNASVTAGIESTQAGADATRLATETNGMTQMPTVRSAEANADAAESNATTAAANAGMAVKDLDYYNRFGTRQGAGGLMQQVNDIANSPLVRKAAGAAGDQAKKAVAASADYTKRNASWLQYMPGFGAAASMQRRK